MSREFLVYADGGSRGNPGPAACGVVIFEDKKKVAEISQFLGRMTNNQAEYQGVIKALEWFEEKGLKGSQINFFLDSQLIVKQLNQRYKLKNQGLKPLFWQIREKILRNGLSCSFGYISREKNTQADRLVNEALDREIG
jgi:ribonuclease HI